jgi:hypothetical protein
MARGSSEMRLIVFYHNKRELDSSSFVEGDPGKRNDASLFKDTRSLDY